MGGAASVAMSESVRLVKAHGWQMLQVAREWIL